MIKRILLAAAFALLLAAMAMPLAATAQTSTPDNSVGSPEVIDNSLLKRDLAADSVGAGEIRTGAVRKSEIAADSVGRSELTLGVEAAICPTGTVMTHSHVMVFDEGVTVTSFSDALTPERAEMAEIVETYLCLPIPPPPAS